MKKCIKCHQEKPFAEFYCHAAMSDGHLGKCKECAKSDVREHRAANLDKIRAYDRKRGQDPRRKAANRARYHQQKNDPKFIKMRRKQRASWLERNTIKRAAHIICGNAKRDGKITPPDKCEKCDETKGLNAHHEDYTKPFEITWLCRDCHGLRHQEINELIRNGEDWSERGF